MPTITLAIIAKNEEENLAQLLPTVAPFVDEIVVVDTGSTDRTREVATRWNANVFQFDSRNHPEAFFLDDEATCKHFGAPGPYSGEIAFADFAAARNESFKHATSDFILWLDCDDVLEGGQNLRALVEDLDRRRLDFGFFAYDYARDDKGRTYYRQWRERVIRRGAADWVNPVHEVLLPRQPVTPLKIDSILAVHMRKPDRKSIPNRNYKILLRQLRQQFDAEPKIKPDPRQLFYLGQEARFIEPMKAAGFYEEYLKLSGWPEERAAAHVALGGLCEFGQLGFPAEESYARANREFATAAVEIPENPDGLFGLARIAYLRGRHQDCIRYSEAGFKIGNTDSMLGANPMDRVYRPHVYYNHSLALVGRVPEAIESCKAALAICADDPGVPGGASGMITFNLKSYEAHMSAQKPTEPSKRPLVEFDKNEDVDAPQVQGIPRDAFVIWAMQLWKRCVAIGDPVKARALIEALPPDVAADPAIARMRASTERRLSANELVVTDTSHRPALNKQSTTLKFKNETTALSVIIWTGPCFEPWDATSPNTRGIGGSETAAIEMGKNLAALGHAVTICGDTRTAPQVFDGVRYVHWEQMPVIDCDVLICSRSPGLLENEDRIKARLKLLWVHDIHVGQPSPQLDRWLLRFDRIMCLSNWHKEFFCQTYPSVHPDRVIVTRNGIDPERFALPMPAGYAARLDAMPGKSNHLVFSSSPNRGLLTLLSLFPNIKRQVPDAEAHIYYGMDCWRTFAKMRGDKNELATIAHYEKAIADAERAGGVHYHGRVNQRELAAAFMRAKVWFYPTLGPELFAETSCISAMEAQAAGCVPLTTAHGALVETVKHGVLIGPNDPNAPQRFIDECVSLLTNGQRQENFAWNGRRYALESLSWSALAKEWAAMFTGLMGDVEANPLQMWRSA